VLAGKPQWVCWVLPGYWLGFYQDVGQEKKAQHVDLNG
jgi:hypothetical protein